MPGINGAELLFAGIGLAEVFNRAGRSLGFDGEFLDVFNRFVNLDTVGYDLECAAGRSTAENDPLFHGKGTG